MEANESSADNNAYDPEEIRSMFIRPPIDNDREFNDLAFNESIFKEIPLPHKMIHLLKDIYGIGWEDGWLDQSHDQLPESIAKRFYDVVAAFENSEVVCQAEVLLGLLNMFPILLQVFADRLFVELPSDLQYRRVLRHLEHAGGKLNHLDELRTDIMRVRRDIRRKSRIRIVFRTRRPPSQAK
ncbi:hypothetical protein D2E26_0747 [Bifidobacterium dolichotidis]|uniref:Uncharacterized protein n=1 Tax=Bifidobacterium dolichotidis TaxID=2306976 RepID=A0A430FTG1_9BIFI|nr:hypothetical protein [Bifidobacterium dolichotidis]RSX56184.1 hypothetical protein D2E26_0747 [Bifidobacterium dolichotidis]